MTTSRTSIAASTAPPTLIAATPSAIRDELTDMVVRDLLGPAGGPDEELNQHEDHAYQRYLVGMLAPKDKEVDSFELDELATGEGDDGEEGAADSGVPAGSTYFPSSMGLSFVVAAETEKILVDADWGQYLRIKSQSQLKKDGNPANVWKRVPVLAPSMPLSLKDGVIAARALILSRSCGDIEFSLILFTPLADSTEISCASLVLAFSFLDIAFFLFCQLCGFFY
jgi:hypothetical protein